MSTRRPGRRAGAALAAALLLAGAAAAQAAPAVLLHNGVIHTESARGTLRQASVLIADGRIVAVGAELTAPAGATTLELNGRPVTPALFGGISHLGVSEVSAEARTNDAVLKSGQMRPEFDPALAFNPDSVAIAVSRADGIGFAVLAPGAEPAARGAAGSSIVAGLASVVRLDGRAPRPPAALEVLLGAESGALAGDSRAASYMLLAEALEEARNPAAATTTDVRLLTPAGRRVLKGVVAEQKPLLVGVDRAADIRAALEFAAREKLRLIVHGGAEAWRVAALLKRADVPVILDPLDDLPMSFDQVGATLDNAARLNAAGVTVAFSLRSSEPHNIRKLRQAAGIAVAHGMPWPAALAAVTSVPAQLFRASAEFGSIEPGKPANLVVWSGDPLEVTSLAEAAWLGGERMTLRSRQTELRDRYLPKVRAGTAR
jgi:imidazolonepropionase-like amidohydrolase